MSVVLPPGSVWGAVTALLPFRFSDRPDSRVPEGVQTHLSLRENASFRKRYMLAFTFEGLTLEESLGKADEAMTSACQCYSTGSAGAGCCPPTKQARRTETFRPNSSHDAVTVFTSWRPRRASASFRHHRTSRWMQFLTPRSNRRSQHHPTAIRASFLVADRFGGRVRDSIGRSSNTQ